MKSIVLKSHPDRADRFSILTVSRDQNLFQSVGTPSFWQIRKFEHI
ncbi:hypothetical protein [Maribacter aurantiacus]|nr:hypothetical protein [Maribacter aurantiacus]